MDRRALLGFVVVACAGVADAAPASNKKTGPNGGLLLTLGTVKAELLVWETELEVHLYDDALKPLMPRGAVVTAMFVDAKKKRREIELARTDVAFRGPAEIAGLPTLDVTLTLTLSGRSHKARTTWSRADDRGRLHDL